MEEKMNKLMGEIKRFLEVYRFLSAEGKAQFEGQMAGSIKKIDESTKKLYQTLLKAAKNGLSVDAAIKEMNKTSQTTE